MKFNHHYKTALIFIAPQIIITMVFFIWPAISAVVKSFYYTDSFGLHEKFAGLNNYLDLIRSPEYFYSLLITIVMAISISFITMFFGLTLAAFVSNLHKSKSIFKTMLLWPYAVAPAVAAILWRFLAHPSLGWLSNFLSFMGINFNYITSGKSAVTLIIITACWQQFSYNFLFYLGALSRVPKDIVEAAIIDGASPWRRFWQIIFPFISPTSFFLLIMNLIYAFFETFGIVHVITNGGPEYSTTTLVYKVYEDGFVGMDPGSSSAQSVLLMIIVTAITLLQFRYLEKKVHY